VVDANEARHESDATAAGTPAPVAV
jgi:hypothetical protein